MKYSILIILFSITILYSDQLCWSQYGADSRHTSNIDVNGILRIPFVEWQFTDEAPGGFMYIYGLSCDEEGNIYFAAIDEEGSVDAHFHSIDKDGNARWEKIPGKLGYKTFPVLDNSRKQVYFDANGLSAYTTNGDVIWTRSDLKNMNDILVSDSGNLYFIKGRISKLKPDGTTIWQKDYKIDYRKTPAIDIDETCYAIDENSILNCIDSLGELKWTFNLGTLTGTKSISIGDSTIFLGCDKNLLCIRKDGTEKWKYGFTTAYYTYYMTGSLTSDNCVVIAKDYKIYCIETDGSLKFEWTDGQYKATSDCPLIIDLQDRVYGLDVCLSKDGTQIWRYSSKSNGLTIIDKFGRLIARDGNGGETYSITCFKQSNSFSSNNSSSSLPTPSLSISPNPFSSRLSVSLPSSGAIYSITGQLIMNLNKGKHSVDTSKWKQGVYIVKSGKETKRIVKINKS